MKIRGKLPPQINHSRRLSGSMLVFTSAAFIGIVLVIALFILSFTRFLAGHQEQTLAIEAATLTAARDLSKIVVEDADFGFLSISDAPPIGKATTAGDNYYLPVTGINTLMATVRLDAILADKFDDQIMRDCAKRDYTRFLTAKDKFITALQNAVKPGGYGFDLDGNKVEPLVDAVKAYNQHAMRMTDRKSSLAPGSMQLSLGCIPQLITSCPIPRPSEFAEMTAAQQSGQFYRSYINVPYKTFDFVFAGIADSTKLVDNKLFVDTIADLPYVIPTIVKCEADQNYEQTDQSGNKSTLTVHAIACAEPGSLNDRRPASGALTLSFPDGAVPEFTSLAAVMTNSNVNKSPSDRTQMPTAGDYPTTALTDSVLPVIGTLRPPVGQLMRVAFYDWLRRVGPQINVATLMTALTSPLDTSTLPHADVFSVDASGNVKQSVMPIDSTISLPVSHMQWYSASGLNFYSKNKNLYDLYIRDYVYQAGRTGGLHAGEPLGDGTDPTVPPPPPVDPTAPPPPFTTTMNESPALMSAFPVGPPGGALRPTYKKSGIAVDFRFHLRPGFGP